MNLYSWGWSDYFAAECPDNKNLARIIAIHRSHLRAVNENNELNLYLPSQSDMEVAVGDWVITTPLFIDEQNQPAALVEKVLTRKSKMARAHEEKVRAQEKVIAANIDNVFIVTSINQDFNINRLHRFLVLIREGGAKSIVILSKIDLVQDYELIVANLQKQLKVDVIGTSIVNNIGINNLLDMMPFGSTSVFVGSSGVGKSSLVNQILGQEVQATKEVRENDDKGRHVTTSRQMFCIPGHGLVIDTPGLRKVEVFGSLESLEETFPEIEAFAQQCKFLDCKHEKEPGCAVKQALDLGKLDIAEWISYKKLKKEMEFINRKLSKTEISNTKKRWREIHLNFRKRKKFENKLNNINVQGRTK